MPEPNNQARRIFHIDDDPDMVHTLAALLVDMGHAVGFTTDSSKAVDLARKFRPEIILMDIGMPRLNGYELCKTFRATSLFAGVIIVAISAYGGDADRAKSRQAGFDAHIQKPVDIHVLHSILAQFGKPLERPRLR